MRSLLAHERRPRFVERPRMPAPALPPDAVGERRQLAARLLAQCRQPGDEFVEGRERPGAIPAQRAAAHQELHARLGVRLQGQRATGRRARIGLARCGQRLLTGGDQRGGRPRAIPVPLLCDPLLKRGRALYGEALEKIARHEPGGIDRAALQQRVESQRIHLECVVAQLDRVASGREARLTDVRPQPSDRFVERVARPRIAGLGPEHSHQVRPGPSAIRRKGEVDEQREVLATQHLGRRRAAGETRGRHPEALKVQGG